MTLSDLYKLTGRKFKHTINSDVMYENKKDTNLKLEQNINTYDDQKYYTDSDSEGNYSSSYQDSYTYFQNYDISNSVSSFDADTSHSSSEESEEKATVDNDKILIDKKFLSTVTNEISYADTAKKSKVLYPKILIYRMKDDINEPTDFVFRILFTYETENKYLDLKHNNDVEILFNRYAIAECRLKTLIERHFLTNSKIHGFIQIVEKNIFKAKHLDHYKKLIQFIENFIDYYYNDGIRLPEYEEVKLLQNYHLK